MKKKILFFGICAIIFAIESGCNPQPYVKIEVGKYRYLPDSSQPLRINIECDIKVSNSSKGSFHFNTVQSVFVIGEDQIICSNQITMFEPQVVNSKESGEFRIQSCKNFGVFIDEETNPRVRVTLLNGEDQVYGPIELKLSTDRADYMGR